MDRPRVYTKCSKSAEKDKYYMISLICMWKPNKIQINLFTKHKQTHRLRENELMVAGGEG